MNQSDRIYCTIGELIEMIQYIEYNLCLELGIDEVSEITLGQLKNLVIEEELFEDETVDELIEILRKRNDLVHQYFKRLDFEKQQSNTVFLLNQSGYLRNLLEQVKDFVRFQLEEK